MLIVNKLVNKPVDYNIEFTHICVDEKFGENQIKSIEILKKKVVAGLKKRERKVLLFACRLMIFTMPY